ncbi:unnamed protein product [Blepharisma stoltei]|uniref:Pentatricopeptide repeat-containing protein n=1 Tax=Blepharisma stoltei TaxID=1481888 RepID=A0AAU9IR68_9CILI|nr:unnamed protein product [Blepharisma stoltei]
MYFARCFRRIGSLKELIRKKDWKSAAELVETKEFTENLEPAHAQSIMWGLSNLGMSNEAYQFINHLSTTKTPPSELEFIAGIEVCIRKGDIPRAMNLVNLSENSQIELDAGVYNELLINGHKTIGLQGVKHVLDLMKKSQLFPSLSVCLALLRSGMWAEDNKLIQDLVLTMEKAKYEIPASLIDEYIKSSVASGKECLELKKTWDGIRDKLGSQIENPKPNCTNPNGFFFLNALNPNQGNLSGDKPDDGLRS